MDILQLENSLKILTEKLIILEANDKSKDREIKELKNKIEVLTTAQNAQALTSQKILSEVEYLRNDFKDIKAYIEELKSQPKKDKDNFTKTVVGAIVGIVIGFIAYTIGLKK